MQQRRNPTGVGHDAGDIAGSRERPDLQRSPLVADEFGFQVHGVDVAVSVLGNHDDVRDGLAPREFVGMVLERSDEDHRPLLGRDDITEVVTVVQVRGDAESEDANQLVDRAGATGSCENHHSVRVAAEGLHDDRAGVFAEPGGLQTGAAGFGMSVGVTREHFVPDEVLQEAQRSTRRGVVGVGDPAWPIRSWHHLVIADDGFPDPSQQRGVEELLGRHPYETRDEGRCGPRTTSIPDQSRQSRMTAPSAVHRTSDQTNPKAAQWPWDSRRRVKRVSGDHLGQNGTPAQCASRAVSAHRFSRPGRTSGAASSRGHGLRSP